MTKEFNESKISPNGVQMVKLRVREASTEIGVVECAAAHGPAVSARPSTWTCGCTQCAAQAQAGMCAGTAHSSSRGPSWIAGPHEEAWITAWFPHAICAVYHGPRLFLGSFLIVHNGFSRPGCNRVVYGRSMDREPISHVVLMVHHEPRPFLDGFTCRIA